MNIRRKNNAVPQLQEFLDEISNVDTYKKEAANQLAQWQARRAENLRLNRLAKTTLENTSKLIENRRQVADNYAQYVVC